MGGAAALWLASWHVGLAATIQVDGFATQAGRRAEAVLRTDFSGGPGASTLQMAVGVSSVDGAPAVTEAIAFATRLARAPDIQLPLGATTLLIGWLSDLPAPLTLVTEIGTVAFVVPSEALVGQRYRVVITEPSASTPSGGNIPLTGAVGYVDVAEGTSSSTTSTTTTPVTGPSTSTGVQTTVPSVSTTLPPTCPQPCDDDDECTTADCAGASGCAGTEIAVTEPDGVRCHVENLRGILGPSALCSSRCTNRLSGRLERVDRRMRRLGSLVTGPGCRRQIAKGFRATADIRRLLLRVVRRKDRGDVVRAGAAVGEVRRLMGRLAELSDARCHGQGGAR